MVQHHYIAINFVLANADPSGHTENGSVTENKENVEITEEISGQQLVTKVKLNRIRFVPEMKVLCRNFDIFQGGFAFYQNVNLKNNIPSSSIYHQCHHF